MWLVILSSDFAISKIQRQYYMQFERGTCAPAFERQALTRNLPSSLQGNAWRI